MKKLPKQARAKARVQTILQVTQDLLLLHGVEGVTTTAISKKAGIPVGSVYQYFEDKEEILSTLYTQAFNDVRLVIEDTVKDLSSDADLAEIVNSLLQTFWKQAWNHPSYRALTRWANAKLGFYDVTPSEESDVTELMQLAFSATGINFPADRYDTILKLCTTVISMIIDIAIEQETEEDAQKLVDELEIMVLRYISS
ncbi:TetR/AcrR family transcriptional regulator [Kordiimonas laminariae]|uniref:TetR/AcrR family transcriptional regulator n=1 Tax=Kordiimonas laminariae TaxID=2917717 RepID=UPI001FF60E91|nr:TetR/AcrR family transcriptional regulator [Kordiimonas laminariae]MCK0070157.1 TetR/AcrR family transcriptional regulator [Kordiimonas laminariae]